MLLDLELHPTTKANQNWSCKKLIGIIVSLLLHLLLVILMFHIFDRDRYQYRPNSTRGYTVELVKPQLRATAGSMADNSDLVHVRGQAHVAQVNLKDSSFELTKSSKKLKANPLITNHQKVSHKGISALKVNAVAVKPQSTTTKSQDIHQTGEIRQITTHIPKQLIVAASAPILDYTKPGSGDAIDSSTNGEGTQSGAFDLRVIEYGREAAYAINQNIVVPKDYRYTSVSYRAFVTLDKNMQFQQMQLVKSTGNQEFDDNIARALRQTVYPPLPNGAAWERFHNIDFTIH
ncbi:MAG: TonB C-terminal domain-containing protein [Burkholderiales bacterium]|nr:TonB C-terminal domain-containing protein [Burkholderiales bacterium]